MANYYTRLWYGQLVNETDEDFQNRMVSFSTVLNDLFDCRDIKLTVIDQVGETYVTVCEYNEKKYNLLIMNIKNSGLRNAPSRKRMQIYHGVPFDGHQTFALAVYNTGDRRVYVSTDISFFLYSARKGKSYSSFWLDFEFIRKCYEKESCYWYDRKDRHLSAMTNVFCKSLHDEEVINRIFYSEADSSLFKKDENIDADFININPQNFDFDYYEKHGKVLPRNPKLRELALERENYTCELCHATTTFDTPQKKQYFEGHHLIMYNIDVQKRYRVSLDNVENIVCLCPTCHKKIHNSTREEIERSVLILLNKHKKLYDIYDIRSGDDIQTIIDDYVKGVDDDE